MPEALIVVDVQRGLDDHVWGGRNTPSCEDNVARRIDAHRRRSEPLVFVRHDSHEDGSPLATGSPGNAFQDVVTGEPDLLVIKHVNSSVLGDPPLDPWLRENGIDGIAICGIQTNMCCETTARMATSATTCGSSSTRRTVFRRSRRRTTWSPRCSKARLATFCMKPRSATGSWHGRTT